MELTVWAHDASDSAVYVDPVLLRASEGALAELWVPVSPEPQFGSPPSDKSDLKPIIDPSNKRGKRKSLYFHVSQPKVGAGSKTLPIISVNAKCLTSLGIRPRNSVYVQVLNSVEAKKKELDLVEIHFKGVQLTRNDHYRIAKSLNGSAVFSGQHVSYLNNSVRLTVETLFKKGRKKFSGVVGENSRIVFRSDSAHILIFIHMTAEMWNFDETGDIMFHRLVNSFIPEMLHKWHTQGDLHLVSLVLFTSVGASEALRSKTDQNWQKYADTKKLPSGLLVKKTRNFYRVVVDSASISRWSDIMSVLRTEFERFPKEVLESPKTHKLRGYFLPSSKSNILEALSLATTLLTSKFVDRDLCRTGVQAMVATAGQACFDVDLSDLWHLSQRLLGVEIGIELVCLARPPLHVTPMFRALLTNEDENKNAEPYRLTFVIPKWINMSFWSSVDRYRQQWIPRCRIYDLQMVGLVDNDSGYLGLKSFEFEANELTSQFMRNFDASVFKSVEMIESQKRIEHMAKNANPLELRPPQRNLQNSQAAMVVTTKAHAKFSELWYPKSATSHPLTPGSISIPVKNSTPSIATTRSDKNSWENKPPRGPLLNPKPSMASFASQTSFSARPSAILAPANPTHSEISPFKTAKDSLSAFLRPPAHTKPTEVATTVADSATSARERASPSSMANQTYQNDARIYAPPSNQATDVPDFSEDIYEQHPAHSEWNLSRSNRDTMARSPLVRLDSTRSNSMGNSRTTTVGSFERDRKLSRSPKGIVLAPNCDLKRPEMDNPSMWRVLPNPATIDNPSRVMAYGRWANVYPPQKHMNGVSWHSLNSPASLPITCENLITLASFKEQYQFQFYDVAVDSDELSLSQILDEMIGLRLQMGFQIAVGASIRSLEASLPRGNPNRVVEIVPKHPKDCIGIRIFLTRVGFIHRLAVDEDRLINVRLYTWIEQNTKRLSCPLNAGRQEDVRVKTMYSDEYETIDKSYFAREPQRLNWSMLDQQVSGADDPLLYPSSANTQNLVSIRYAIIPVDFKPPAGSELTPEEIRVEGLTKMVKFLLKHRESSTSTNTNSSDSNFVIQYYTGSVAKAIKETMIKHDNHLETNRLTKSISLHDLANEMQGPLGVRFQDRRWHWKMYKRIFTGSDLVNWLQKTFQDISTSEDAEVYGASLMCQGLFRHSENRHQFLNGYYFYSMMPQYQKFKSEVNNVGHQDENISPALSSEEGSLVSTRTSSPLINLNNSNLPSPSSPHHAYAPNRDRIMDRRYPTPPHLPMRSATDTKRTIIHASESFVVNVDPRNISGRPERVKVCIDRLHNPKNAYHIIVEWLSATPRLVDELFSSVGRLVSQHGLRLVQVPLVDVAQAVRLSPFRSTMRFRLSIDIPQSDEARRFRRYVLRQCGYCLDVHDLEDVVTSEFDVLFGWGKLRQISTQYIHNSGYVIAQAVDDQDLWVAANTLHVSRTVLANNVASNADSEAELLMYELRALCTDAGRLQRMFQEARKSWQAKAAPIRRDSRTD